MSRNTDTVNQLPRPGEDPEEVLNPRPNAKKTLALLIAVMGLAYAAVAFIRYMFGG